MVFYPSWLKKSDFCNLCVLNFIKRFILWIRVSGVRISIMIRFIVITSGVTEVELLASGLYDSFTAFVKYSFTLKFGEKCQLALSLFALSRSFFVKMSTRYSLSLSVRSILQILSISWSHGLPFSTFSEVSSGPGMKDVFTQKWKIFSFFSILFCLWKNSTLMSPHTGNGWGNSKDMNLSSHHVGPELEAGRPQTEDCMFHHWTLE